MVPGALTGPGTFQSNPVDLTSRHPRLRSGVNKIPLRGYVGDGNPTRGIVYDGFMNDPLKYLSVCSGIEAATVAWHPLGWQPVGFSEIEPFPSAVLAHHYPHVPNYGDMTKFQEWPLDAGSINLLVGGTPCQSFSVAGLRQGLKDPRGNLMLTYLAIAARLRPQWVVWENVPGVLSSNGGRDFGSFLGGLGQLGYGFAYRVLDAQWCRTHGHPRAVPQRRRRVFVVGCLGDATAAATVLLKQQSVLRNSKTRGTAREEIASDVEGRVRTNCVAIQGNLIGRDKGGPTGVGASTDGVMYTMTKADVHGVAQAMNVRRLTVRECERLQAFPDDYTRISWRKKAAGDCPDGPRYKALGNSMAVNCMEWIGERIAAVEAEEDK